MKGIVLAVVLSVFATGFATAQQSAEVESIRKEMEEMRRDYEKRLKLLEDRLKQLESPPPAAVTAIPTNVVSSAMANTNATDTAHAAGLSLSPGEFRFRHQTESRQQAIASRQEAALRERMEQVLEGFIDITGYFRAGYGVNDRGSPQTAFQAPGAFAKYRLGNEPEMYGELGFGKNFYLPNLFSLNPSERPSTGSTGPVARVQVLLSAYNPYEDLLSASATDFGLPEAWASIGNVVPGQPSMKVWAGSRYYRRHDIHINDFYFYNMSGAGGGVEDIELPFGKFGIAWLGNGASSGFTDVPQPDPENEAGFSKGNLDVRLYDVPLPLGRGEFGVALARSQSGRDANGNSLEDTEGIAFSAIHTADRFISADGQNKFSLQFGTGPAKTFTSGFETISLPAGLFIRPDESDSWRFRATEHFMANVNDHFSIGPVVVYQATDYSGDGDLVHWGSAGVRPILHFNRYVSVAFESGVDWVKDDEAGTSDFLGKLTLAPQVSLGNRFLSRPVVRAYVTHAFWGDDFEGSIGGSDYRSSRSGWTYGLQMEAWW